MRVIKKILGFVWFMAGPILIWLLVSGAVSNIDSNGTKDINKSVPWIIIISIFIPVAIGLMIFGYYSMNGEYGENTQEPE